MQSKTVILLVSLIVLVFVNLVPSSTMPRRKMMKLKKLAALALILKSQKKKMYAIPIPIPLPIPIYKNKVMGQAEFVQDQMVVNGAQHHPNHHGFQANSMAHSGHMVIEQQPVIAHHQFHQVPVQMSFPLNHHHHHSNPSTVPLPVEYHQQNC
ncbi:uncharacterized protein LOC107359637 [Tetranychus urticae]|uniref:uncharacterized protein LOC107359637 n=1 Tax=Tetranychus urticae TaxID=32264 RepID=UPI00077B8A2E|nr:uncharacterized protein LOC107359637 [Tetranychus urticae]